MSKAEEERLKDRQDIYRAVDLAIARIESEKDETRSFGPKMFADFMRQQYKTKEARLFHTLNTIAMNILSLELLNKDTE